MLHEPFLGIRFYVAEQDVDGNSVVLISALGTTYVRGVTQALRLDIIHVTGSDTLDKNPNIEQGLPEAVTRVPLIILKYQPQIIVYPICKFTFQLTNQYNSRPTRH